MSPRTPTRPSRPQKDPFTVAVEVVLLSAWENDLYTVVRRTGSAVPGRWELPGALLRRGESLDAAAQRALTAEAGLRTVFLEQLYTFGAAPGEGRASSLTVAYYALVDRDRLTRGRRPGDQVAVPRVVVPWEGETGGPVELMAAEGRELPLAFDHADIIGTAVKRVRGKLDYTPIGFQLLPDRFTLLDLQRVHEIVLGRPSNKDSFRRRMLASGLLEATGEQQAGVGHRPAELYRFARRSAV